MRACEALIFGADGPGLGKPGVFVLPGPAAGEIRQRMLYCTPRYVRLPSILNASRHPTTGVAWCASPHRPRR